MTHPRMAQKRDDADEEQPVLVDLCRMIWMVFGPAGILLSTAAVWAQPPGVWSHADLTFGVVVLGTIFANFLDARISRASNGEAVNGKSSLPYAATLSTAAIILWGIVHLVRSGR